MIAPQRCGFRIRRMAPQNPGKMWAGSRHKSVRRLAKPVARPSSHAGVAIRLSMTVKMAAQHIVARANDTGISTNPIGSQLSQCTRSCASQTSQSHHVQAAKLTRDGNHALLEWVTSAKKVGNGSGSQLAGIIAVFDERAAVDAVGLRRCVGLC